MQRVQLFFSCRLKANANRVQEDLDTEFSSLHAVLDELKEGMVTRIKQERASRTYELQVRALCVSTRMWLKLALCIKSCRIPRGVVTENLVSNSDGLDLSGSLCFPYTAVTVRGIYLSCIGRKNCHKIQTFSRSMKRCLLNALLGHQKP